MNKAKFMLLGIGVVGVVSGALAFKAQKFTGTKFCTATTSSTCPTSAKYKVSSIGTQLNLRCTATSGANCTQTITVVAVND